MTRRIYKYALPLPGETYRLPANITPRHVALQHDKPCLWAEVDIDAEPSNDRITVYCIGTGFDIPDGLTYIGTVQQHGFVWHFYTLPPNTVEPW